MSGRNRLAILCTLLVTLAACEDDPVSPVSPPPDKPPSWWLEADSMNVAILVLNFSTYELEKGCLDHYALCDSCDRDSLPFHVDYDPPDDLGDVTFTYTHTGETILYATEVYMGHGRIVYPRDFLAAGEFHKLPWRFAPPSTIEYFENAGKTDPSAKADSAWSSVSSLDIVGEFAKRDYRVGIFRYVFSPINAGPEDMSWVVFLYRGSQPNYLSGSTGTQATCAKPGAVQQTRQPDNPAVHGPFRE